MNLNLHTDYALRILMALAATNRQMSVNEIANGYGISHNHLAKVVQRLQSLKYIETIRGRSGGVKLAQRPEEINVGSVVRSLESMEKLVACMSPNGSGCAIDGMCGLKNVLSEAVQDFLSRLDKHTLADIMPKPKAFMLRMQNSNV